MITVEFELERVTKNTGRFTEVSATTEDGEEVTGKVVGYIYVQKSALKVLGGPEALVVTISAGGGG